MNKRTVIEVVGFPGSGKSYSVSNLKIRKSIVVYNEDSFYLECSNINTLDKVVYLILNLLSIFKLYRLLGSYEKERGIYSHCHDMNVEFLKYYLLQKIVLRKLDSEYVLLDQWLIQFVVSIGLSSDKKLLPTKSLRRLINYVVKDIDYYMIFYNVEQETIINRIKKRPNKFWMESLPEAELKRFYSIHCDDYSVVGKFFVNDRYYVVKNIKDMKNVINNILAKK